MYKAKGAELTLDQSTICLYEAKGAELTLIRARSACTRLRGQS